MSDVWGCACHNGPDRERWLGECDRGSEVVIVCCEVIMVVYFDTQSWPICCVQINRANLYKLPCVVEVNREWWYLFGIKKTYYSASRPVYHCVWRRVDSMLNEYCGHRCLLWGDASSSISPWVLAVWKSPMFNLCFLFLCWRYTEMTVFSLIMHETFCWATL